VKKSGGNLDHAGGLQPCATVTNRSRIRWHTIVVAREFCTSHLQRFSWGPETTRHYRHILELRTQHNLPHYCDIRGEGELDESIDEEQLRDSWDSRRGCRPTLAFFFLSVPRTCFSQLASCPCARPAPPCTRSDREKKECRGN